MVLTIHVSEDDSDESFPNFMVVETTDSTPIKFSIFTIQKNHQCAVRIAKSVKTTTQWCSPCCGGLQAYGEASAVDDDLA